MSDLLIAADLLLGQHGHTYQPRGGAKEAYEADDPEVLVSGPYGTGKSRAVLESIHRDAQRHDSAKFLLVRKTRASLTSTGLRTWEEHVVDKAMADGDVTFFGGNDRLPAHYRYRSTGAMVITGGLSTKNEIDKVLSSEYDRIFVQEATEITLTDWEKLTGRLRNGRMPYSQLIGDCNPDAPTHWLKVRCDRGQTRMITSRHEDNPTLFHHDGSKTEHGALYLSRLDALTGVRHLRYRLGKWAAAEGMIYEQWDPTVNLVPSRHIPMDWPRFVAVDFGYENPFTAQWWARDPDGRLWLYRQIYMTRRLVSDHAKQIRSLIRDEPWPDEWICDHDAEGRATLATELGIKTTAAKKTVKEGIQLVQARMVPAGDGQPRLLIVRDSLVERDPALVEAALPTCVEEEIPSYVWKKPTHEGDPPQEEPVKKDDHGLDALRYVVAHFDLDLGATRQLKVRR